MNKQLTPHEPLKTNVVYKIQGSLGYGTCSPIEASEVHDHTREKSYDGVDVPRLSKDGPDCAVSGARVPSWLSAFLNRRLVTAFYGASIVAEQGHVRKPWMSRVKHPMSRLGQNVTT